MASITEQGNAPMATLIKALKFIDIVAQNIQLCCCFNYCRNGIMPITKQFKYPILSFAWLIFLALGSILLYKPVCSFLAHRSNAKLTSLAPCPGFESCSLNVGKSPPARISNIFRLDETE